MAERDADLLVDRRQLTRRLVLWRVAAVLLGVLAVFLLIGRQTGMTSGLAGLAGPHIARLQVSGIIGDDRRITDALDRAARDTSVSALIVMIDSPGGTVGGGEALYSAIQRVRAVKPVVAVMGGTAASAGYMIALPAERVFARESTVTGSIGVLLQAIEGSELLARLGIRADIIASGPLKDQPNPFHPLSPEGRASLDGVVRDMYDQFVERVAAGRHMAQPAVRALADGRVFTGRQALAAGLIDAIGGETEARAWLAATHQIPADQRIRAIEPRGTAERIFGAAIGWTVKSLISEWLAVDGFRALWQPSG